MLPPLLPLVLLPLPGSATLPSLNPLDTLLSSALLIRTVATSCPLLGLQAGGNGLLAEAINKMSEYHS